MTLNKDNNFKMSLHLAQRILVNLKMLVTQSGFWGGQSVDSPYYYIKRNKEVVSDRSSAIKII